MTMIHIGDVTIPLPGDVTIRLPFHYLSLSREAEVNRVYLGKVVE